MTGSASCSTPSTTHGVGVVSALFVLLMGCSDKDSMPRVGESDAAADAPAIADTSTLLDLPSEATGQAALKIDAGRVPDSTLLDVPSEATGQAALAIDAGRVPDSALGSAAACNPAPTCPAGWFLNASKICSCTLGGGL